MSLENQQPEAVKTTTDLALLDLPAKPPIKNASVDRFLQTADQQRLMHQLSKEKMVAEETLRNYTTYLATNAFDVRTAFSVIIGYSEMFLNDMHKNTGEDLTAEYAKSILSSSHRLLHQINDLLDLSKIDAEQLDLNEDLIDVNRLITEVASKMEERIKKANLNFNVTVAPDLPKIFLDDQRIQQAISNLISNAIKFTLFGGQVELNAFKNADGCLEIQVIDNGVGMKISAIPGALTEFGKATHNSHPCTGLGLPLARRLVELHGGTLNLESKLNFGTTILFTLPATRWQDHSQ